MGRGAEVAALRVLTESETPAVQRRHPNSRGIQLIR